MRLPRKRMSPVAQLSLEEVFLAEESPLPAVCLWFVGGDENLPKRWCKMPSLSSTNTGMRSKYPAHGFSAAVRNFSFNILRKSKRETLDEKPEERESALERPDDELGRLEAVGMIQMLVSEMEDRDQSMVRMKYFQDLKYQEIADKLEMSVGNVGYRLHHLLKDLGERLRKSGITHF